MAGHLPPWVHRPDATPRERGTGSQRIMLLLGRLLRFYSGQDCTLEVEPTILLDDGELLRRRSVPLRTPGQLIGARNQLGMPLEWPGRLTRSKRPQLVTAITAITIATNTTIAANSTPSFIFMTPCHSSS